MASVTGKVLYSRRKETSVFDLFLQRSAPFMMLDSSSKPYSSNTLLRSYYQILPSSWTLCRINGSFANEFTEAILLRQGEMYDLQTYLIFSSLTILETYSTKFTPCSQTAFLVLSFTTAICVVEASSQVNWCFPIDVSWNGFRCTLKIPCWVWESRGWALADLLRQFPLTPLAWKIPHVFWNTVRASTFSPSDMKASKMNS